MREPYAVRDPGGRLVERSRGLTAAHRASRRRGNIGSSVERNRVEPTPAGAKTYEYVMLLRPYSFATVPPGTIGFRPSKNPKQYPHGVVQYSKPLSRANVVNFDMWPLDPVDPMNIRRVFDAWVQESQARFIDGGESLVLDDEETGGRETLTYSTRPGVDFQVTHWTRIGGRGKAHVGGRLEPTGHDEYNDWADAARGMLSRAERAKLVARLVPDA